MNSRVAPLRTGIQSSICTEAVVVYDEALYESTEKSNSASLVCTLLLTHTSTAVVSSPPMAMQHHTGLHEHFEHAVFATKFMVRTVPSHRDARRGPVRTCHAQETRQGLEIEQAEGSGLVPRRPFGRSQFAGLKPVFDPNPWMDVLFRADLVLVLSLQRSLEKWLVTSAFIRTFRASVVS